MVTYTDTESTIDTTSLTGVIYNWNATTGTWATIATLGYMSVSGATTSTGYINISGLPFGKYRFDISISDSAENKATKSYTYFVDGVEWTISSDTYNIGNISQNITTFGTGELIITIKTVGAGFRLVSNPISALSRPTGESLNYWNNTLGV